MEGISEFTSSFWFHSTQTMLRRRAPLFVCLLYLQLCSVAHSIDGDTLSSAQILKDGESLVSSGGTFKMGFFSPGASKYRYLGIWFTDSYGAVVWVANRDNPITDHGGSLTMDETGNLVIFNSTKSMVWSSNLTTSLVNPVAQLLETGNFILRGNSGDTIFWQSFDYPTDTALPKVKIGKNFKTGRETYLRSWRNLEDPSSGAYTYRLRLDILPQFVLASESGEIYRTGPWKGSYFDALAGHVEYNVFKLTVTKNENETYSFYEPVNSSVISRITVNGSGFVQRYVKYNHNESWNNIYWSPIDTCDNYAQCGINGICSAKNLHPCQCLKGFQRDGVEYLDSNIWDSKTNCVRKTALNCPKGEGFLRLENVKLPDMKNVTWNQPMGIDECKTDCLKNCTCTAYANLNVNGTGKGCMMWFGDLVDLRYQTLGKLGAQDLFIRLPHSELGNSSTKKTILLAVLTALIFFTLLFIGIILFNRMKRNSNGNPTCMDDIQVTVFDFNTVDKATGGFSERNIIGEGGFGIVYKGKLPGGQDVAVKRLSKFSGQGFEEFKNEATLIANLKHRNLVSLLGICLRGDQKMLIFEYMPNKSLDYFLFEKKETNSLTWKERFNIIMGVARGLLYLHQDSKLQVVHRDLKAANILLDSFMNPKISDFGIARIFSDNANQVRTERIIGTYGYMSPEYANDGKFSVKSDVFSFGVLILEIISSKRNRGFSHSDHSQSLLGHAWMMWIGGQGLDLIDPDLQSSAPTCEALRCIHVGLLCVQRHPPDRPDMSTVVFMLANEGISLPPPKQPGFFLIEQNSSATNLFIHACGESHFTASNSSITMLQSR